MVRGVIGGAIHFDGGGAPQCSAFTLAMFRPFIGLEVLKKAEEA